ncbi:hypothetical protein KY310_03465 [Candidatus Woesearchaeota archaeon]|nr:hypothetical protein [Candidatus Woesearchaeota archaeon]
MKYAIFIIGIFVIGLVALLAVMQPIPTGFAVQEEPVPLIEKVSKPCFCASGDNIEQQITEQQTAYNSIVSSAEEAVKRNEIAEKTAIKVLNNHAERSCKKCS